MFSQEKLKEVARSVLLEPRAGEEKIGEEELDRIMAEVEPFSYEKYLDEFRRGEGYFEHYAEDLKLLGEEIDRAFEKMDEKKVSLIGRFVGVLPHSGEFEFETDSGEVLYCSFECCSGEEKGRIDDEYAEWILSLLQGGLLGRRVAIQVFPASVFDRECCSKYDYIFDRGDPCSIVFFPVGALSTPIIPAF